MENTHLPAQDLIVVYDSYGDFNRRPYFAHCYQVLPSSLRFEAPLKETKENMEAVLSLIDFETYTLQYAHKAWNTKDVKNADQAEDFVHYHLLQSSTKSLIVMVLLDKNEIEVDFLYDVHDKEVEEWAIAAHQKIRTHFGETRASSFKILSREGGSFHTEEVSSGNLTKMDLNTHYNADFLEINDIVCNSFEEEKSGLILLHGKPGTGKTSYIKHLISVFEEKTFIFIQNEFVGDLLKPEFISFLIRNKDAVLIIEDAERVIMARETTKESVVSTILQLTDGLFSDYLNIKIICTFNSDLEKVDKALLRKGRIIANYEFSALSEGKTKALAESLGYGKAKGEMTLAEIFNLDKKDFSKPDPGAIGFK